jgi:DNA polymerase III delta subunit
MISGKDDFRRERCKREFFNMFAGSGGDVEEVSLKRFRSKLASRSFFAGPCLFVLAEMDEGCYDLLLRHKNSPFPGVVVLVVTPEAIRKDTILGRLSTVLGPTRHKKFDPIPTSKQFDAGCEFLLKEIRAQGLSISARVARKIVDNVGSELGFLFYQAWKLVHLAKFEGLSEVSEELVDRLSLQAFETSLFPLVDSIGNKQPTRCLREMWRIKKTLVSPTMKVCRFVGSFVVKWKATQNLVSREVEEKEIVKMLNVSPWYYQNKLSKISARWSPDELGEMVLICSDTEQAVFAGKTDPWTFFCSRTYNLISSSRG